MSVNFTTALLALTGLMISHCGVVSLGANVPNDPVPAGTPAVSGYFTGAPAINGAVVTGNVYIYSNSGSYTLRLENFNSPDDPGLQINLTVGGTVLNGMSLRAFSGNMNYSISLSSDPTGSTGTCAIFSAPLNYNLGSAPLH